MYWTRENCAHGSQEKREYQAAGSGSQRTLGLRLKAVAFGQNFKAYQPHNRDATEYDCGSDNERAIRMADHAIAEAVNQVEQGVEFAGGQERLWQPFDGIKRAGEKS
jgi:hypothetical protein